MDMHMLCACCVRTYVYTITCCIIVDKSKKTIENYQKHNFIIYAHIKR